MNAQSHNTVLQMNILRHNIAVEALKPHGLAVRRNCIVDETLSPTMQTVVCQFDTKQIDLEQTFEVSQVKEVLDYINNGRSKRIDTFLQEQEEAHAWSNRPNSIIGHYSH